MQNTGILHLKKSTCLYWNSTIYRSFSSAVVITGLVLISQPQHTTLRTRSESPHFSSSLLHQIPNSFINNLTTQTYLRSLIVLRGVGQEPHPESLILSWKLSCWASCISQLWLSACLGLRSSRWELCGSLIPSILYVQCSRTHLSCHWNL